ncbi:DAK2 domain-containing protein [Enterococcus faecium]|nr:DAK2 domain-containing protein [Enterococcus faecium]
MQQNHKSYLSDLDTPIGDGDHGNDMGRGVSAFEDAFKKEEPTTINDTFKVLSMAMISKVGGASGPLYGSAFMNMMKATKDVDVINSQEQLGKSSKKVQMGYKQEEKLKQRIKQC